MSAHEPARAHLLSVLPLLAALRHDLHRHPTVSLEEQPTAARLLAFLAAHGGDVWRERVEVRSGVGGAGVLATFDTGVEGPCVLFRTELDALPIEETNKHLEYSSLVLGASHKCGHDGHMAIVCGLALVVLRHPPPCGKVMFLMQPAEEIGSGARAMLQDKCFAQTTPDFLFALHNLPEYPLGTAVVREGVFASASRGVSIRMDGTTAHACSPHLGKSPAAAVAHLLQALPALPSSISSFEEAVLVTIVHARLGSKRFGTAPADAEVCATLRAHTNAHMDELVRRVEAVSAGLATAYGLQCTVEYEDVFAATVNDGWCVAEAAAVAGDEVGLEVHRKQHPFAWSEDFGEFLQVHARGCMFGLGGGVHGEETAPLHRSDYNFNDKLIESGVMIFYGLLHRCHALASSSHS